MKDLVRSGALVLAVVLAWVAGGAAWLLLHDDAEPAAHKSTPALLTSQLFADLSLPQREVRPGELKARPKPRPRLAEAAASNPLAGRPWGVYLGNGDQVSAPYLSSHGARRAELAKIALQPRAKWFGGWIGDGEIESSVRDYVAESQHGNPDTLVQMAVFRMSPWEHEACRRGPSAGEASSYRRWIDGFARGVGDAHAAIILQPDGPFALCSPQRGASAALVAYSAKVLAALPHTSVYLDAGAGDWPSSYDGGAGAAVSFLMDSGIEHVRGIALNSTHYSATSAEVERGAEIIRLLDARGVHGKRMVVNTSSNGHPFVFGDYRGPDPDDAWVCGSAHSTGTCVTLGIPPTTDVTSSRWGLSSSVRDLAGRYVDAYMWFGRPWLHRQNDPFVMDRALGLVRSSPYL